MASILRQLNTIQHKLRRPSSIKAPAFYNVFVTLKERDIFQLDYFFYDREARSVMGVYKEVNPELAERNYKWHPG